MRIGDLRPQFEGGKGQLLYFNPVRDPMENVSNGVYNDLKNGYNPAFCNGNLEYVGRCGLCSNTGCIF